MLLSVLQSTTPTNVRLESNLVTHTIMVVGTAEEVATVGKKIDELQKEIPNLPKKTLRQYPLHANDSTTLLSILKGAHPNATIVADLAQKSLFITANDKEHEEIGAWIKTYDLPRDPVFLPIKPRTSTSVIASLKSLYPGVTMTLDTTANRVMVLADPASQKRIAGSIQVLEAGLDTGEKTARVFRIDPDKHDVLAISTHLRTLVPAQIQLEPNTRSASILALGNESELELVQQKLEMLQQQMVLTATATAVVYKVQNAPRESVRGINTVISSLYKDINSYSDPTNGTIVVTATEAQHKKIADIIEGYDQSTVDIETRVFNLSKADASSLRTSMAEANPRVSVTADRKTNSLIVTAPKSELERIEKTIQNIESSNENPMTTQTYRLMSSEPTSLARALDESYPNASITADATNGAIYVAATPQEHEAIKKLVDELNLQPSNQSNFKIATLKYANPESLAKSITAALGPRSRLNVSTLKESRSLFAFGSQADLRAFEQLIQELDKPQQSGSERQFETFPLKGVDGISIVSSLTKLLSGADEPADLKYDQLNGRLMAAGTADQIVKIKEALSKFEAPKREFDIFPLKTIDSFTFRTAADALFEQESGINPPTINVDSSLQQVLVHGTREQLDRIQQLLDRMGAGSKSVLRDKSQGGVRFIPINRNPQALLENVERLWPLIRANPVQIIDPKKIPKGNLENPQSNHPRSPWGSRSRLVAFQDPAETATQPASPTQEAKQSQPIDRTSTEPKADNAPVIVITGDEQWTVASDDAEALSQFENLLDTLLNPRVQPYANAGNFGVYILRHADATEARELLMDLFGISTQRSSFFSSSMQRLKIVADPRINALVIGGNLAERKTAEELLAVIDSQDLIDRLQQITPSILPLQTANAKNVLDIVKDVYKSQLSSGAGRKPLPIPDGVSTEVATMFQQINAASSGPLLAVSLDPTSNSLVIRGPSDLTQELIKFIEEIDRQAEVAPSQKIQVLRLESANAANLEKALRLLYSKQ
jgi:type II secretory pathway component GspD/PulD (secretin)